MAAISGALDYCNSQFSNENLWRFRPDDCDNKVKRI